MEPFGKAHRRKRRRGDLFEFASLPVLTAMFLVVITQATARIGSVPPSLYWCRVGFLAATMVLVVELAWRVAREVAISRSEREAARGRSAF